MRASCVVILAFAVLVIGADFANAATVFPGAGQISRFSRPVFGTKCVIDFDSTMDPLQIDQRLVNADTIFRISDRKFLKKLKAHLSSVQSNLRIDEYGNEELIFFSFKAEVDSWPHLNEFSITAHSINSLDGDGMLRVVFRLSKVSENQFEVKDFYVIQGRGTSFDCRY